MELEGVNLSDDMLVTFAIRGHTADEPDNEMCGDSQRIGVTDTDIVIT